MNFSYDFNRVITGDAYILSKSIPDHSVDCIFTDPVYEDVEAYTWLSAIARRVLKSNAPLLCWSNGAWHYQNTKWLEATGLTYRWTFTHFNMDTFAPLNGRIISKCNRVMWFDLNGTSKLMGYTPDGYATHSRKTTIGKVPFKWYKSAPYTMTLLRGFCNPGDIVFDPFAGSATTAACCLQMGMKCLSFEIDPVTAEIGQERIRQTNPPLPLIFRDNQKQYSFLKK